MPIDILKFIYKEFTAEDSTSWKTLTKLPSGFWAEYWRSQEGVVTSLAKYNVDIETVEELQKLKRLHFNIDLANCVFDKLN